MAGVNFQPSTDKYELVSSIADGVIMQIEDLHVPAGTSKNIIFNNLTDITFKLNQTLLFSSHPDVNMEGKSQILSTLYLNTIVEDNLLSAPETSVYSNSNKGELYNIKGFLVDGFAVAEFDTMKYNRDILLHSHCIANKDATGLFLTYADDTLFAKPIYLGPRKQVVLRITNSKLDSTGIDSVHNITISGNFVTSKPGLPLIPITADSSAVTVDNTDITVDQTEL